MEKGAGMDQLKVPPEILRAAYMEYHDLFLITSRGSCRLHRQASYLGRPWRVPWRGAEANSSEIVRPPHRRLYWADNQNSVVHLLTS